MFSFFTYIFFQIQKKLFIFRAQVKSVKFFGNPKNINFGSKIEFFKIAKNDNLRKNKKLFMFSPQAFINEIDEIAREAGNFGDFVNKCKKTQNHTYFSV